MILDWDGPSSNMTDVLIRIGEETQTKRHMEGEDPMTRESGG